MKFLINGGVNTTRHTSNTSRKSGKPTTSTNASVKANALTRKGASLGWEDCLSIVNSRFLGSRDWREKSVGGGRRTQSGPWAVVVLQKSLFHRPLGSSRPQ